MALLEKDPGAGDVVAIGNFLYAALQWERLRYGRWWSDSLG